MGKAIDSLMAGLTPEDIAAVIAARNNKSTTKVKSGVYTQTQESTTVPNALALVDNINKVYQKYYGRDANQNELDVLLPQAQAMYKTPQGSTRSNIQYTYKDGNLVDTKYLTADNLDPIQVIEDKVKTDLSSGKTTVNKLNIPEGPAGKFFVNVKNLAAANGINLSDQAAGDYAGKLAAGTLDENTVANTIRESAASAFPQFADKIKAGVDLQTLADPYIQSMSKILEVPSAGIDLFDPTIRGALSYTTPDGKVGTKSLYDFEKGLRQDPRWQYTQNAKQDVASSVQKVLQDFGFMG
jgi:hypothetical protein